jgi:heat-inducible transcriptional repressor
MEDRYVDILTGAVNLYIETGQPVSSGALLRRYNWELSPATVRAVLLELDEMGYLYQPHTSAGRIPTDKGYRFMVSRLQEQVVSANERESLRRQMAQLAEQYQQLASSTSKLLSHMVHAVAICSVPQLKDTRGSGLMELMKHPEGDFVEAIREVSLLLDQADKLLHEIPEETRQKPSVYIGEENPFLPAKHTSLVARTVEVPRYGEIVLCVIGPKRMPYRRNVALINALTEIMEDNNL